MITEQELIDKGFRKYPNTDDVVFPYSDFFYQKKFVDDIGVKYFVEVVHYAVDTFSNGNRLPESWMVHLNINEPHMRFEQYRVDDLDYALERCETFFQTLDCNHYEIY
jgi:hypothetical protein